MKISGENVKWRCKVDVYNIVDVITKYGVG